MCYREISGSRELANKAAEKIQGTYFVADDYLRAHPDGNFDGFIDVYLEAEAQKLPNERPRLRKM